MTPVNQKLRKVLGVGRRAAIRVTTRPSDRHGLVGRPELWAMKRRFQIEFLTGHGLQPQHRLLDLGCGTLRGGIPLIEYLEPGHYVGVEARAEVLAEGRSELLEAGLEDRRPELICAADPDDVHVADRVDFMWAFSVLIHMTDPIAEASFGLAARALVPGGEFFANVQLGEREEGHWQGFPVVFRSREFYRELAERHGLTMREMGPLGSVGHHTGTGQDAQPMMAFARGG